MNERDVRTALLLVPGCVVALFELVRHTRWVLSLLPMETSNWITAVLAALVTAAISRQLFVRLDALHEEVARAREREILAAEHKKMAEKLHDDIGQTLFFIGVQLDHARRKLETDHPAREHLVEIQDALREVDDELRRTILDLRPSSREPTDEKAWAQHLEEFGAGLGVDVLVTGNPPRLDPKTWPILAAMSREAIINSVKHGRANRILFAWSGPGRRWELTIADDGRPGEHRRDVAEEGHYGLALMKQRAASIGADVRLEHTPAGMRIHLTAPEHLVAHPLRTGRRLPGRISTNTRGHPKTE
ncbi:MAG: histidine kinase [Kyrpidia sp.]|nr:histidine kinase [Kyrpidia sp.]